MPFRQTLRSVFPSPSSRATLSDSDINSLNHLGLRVFAALPETNALISPLSIAASLTLAAEGAEPSTVAYRQWRALLPAPVPPITPTDKSVTLHIANAAWVGQVRDEYVRAVKKLGAHVTTLPDKVDDLNAWVSNATHANIPTLLDQLPHPLVAILVNAVFFKAPWTTTFDKSDTVSRPFRGAPNVNMMNLRKETFYYKEVPMAGGTLQVVEIPYGSAEFTAVAVLPPETVTLDNVVAQLKEGDREWNKWTHGLVETKLDVLAMPRFKLEFGAVSLKHILQGMGVTKPWKIDAADPPFKRMTDDREAYLSDVLHKASLECTEEGTVASAATAAIIMTRSLPRPNPSVVMDRPFLFAIKGKDGGLLFIGRVDRPMEP